MERANEFWVSPQIFSSYEVLPTIFLLFPISGDYLL